MRTSQRLASALAIAAVITATSARALADSGETCAKAIVRGDAELAKRVREAIEGRDDVDACAHVTITKSRGAITVAVELADGRSTSRSVARREDVVPIVEALLLVPRREEPEAASRDDDAESDGSTLESTPPSAIAPPRDVPPNADAKSAVIVRPGSLRHILFELSASAGARVTSDQPSTSFGLLSFVEAGGWLAGFTGRADVYAGLSQEPRGTTLSLGLVGGRRFRFAQVSLDIYGGPTLTALKGSGNPDAPATVSMRQEVRTESGVAPRVVVGSRLGFLPRSILRPFVAVDGDFGSQGGTQGPRDEDRLPAWTLGGAIGATVGSL